MVRRLLHFFNTELGGLHQAALLLGLSSLASQLLGLFRDRLLASTFGAAQQLDVYYAAFRIPDLIFVGIGSFLAVTVVIPILLEREATASLAAQRQLMHSLLTVFLGMMVLTACIVVPLLPWLLPLIAPGFSPPVQADLYTLTLVLMLSPLLLGLSNLLGAVTQAKRRFLLYALSPLLYNVGIIAGILFLYPVFGVLGIVYGVIVGASLHVLVQVPTIVRAGLFPRCTLRLHWQEVRLVLSRSLPRTLALGSNQLVLVVLLALASSMAVGSIAVFTFAFNLQSVPLALIGVSYSVAAFPTMAKLYAEGKRDLFLDYTTEALRHIIFWALPVVALFVVLRAHLVRVILGSGNFSWEDTRLTAAVLAVLTFAVLFQSIVQLLDRAYYAAGRTREPVLVKLASSGVAIVCGFVLPILFVTIPSFFSLLLRVFRIEDVAGGEVLALPLAFSIGMLVNVLLLAYLFTRTFGGSSLRASARTLLQALCGALVIGLVARGTLELTSSYVDLHYTFGVFLQGLTAGVLGIIAGIIVLRCVRSKELEEIRQSLHRHLGRIFPIFPGPEDLG